MSGIAIGSLVTPPAVGETSARLPSNQATIIAAETTGEYQIRFSSGEKAIIALPGTQAYVGDQLILKNAPSGMIQVLIQSPAKVLMPADSAQIRVSPGTIPEIVQMLETVADRFVEATPDSKDIARIRSILDSLQKQSSGVPQTIVAQCNRIESMLGKSIEQDGLGPGDSALISKLIRQLSAEIIRELGPQALFKSLQTDLGIPSGIYAFQTADEALEWLQKNGVSKDALTLPPGNLPLYIEASVIENEFSRMSLSFIKQSDVLAACVQLGMPLAAAASGSGLSSDFLAALLLQRGQLKAQEFPNLLLGLQHTIKMVVDQPINSQVAVSSLAATQTILDASRPEIASLVAAYPEPIKGLQSDFVALRTLTWACNTSASITTPLLDQEFPMRLGTNLPRALEDAGLGLVSANKKIDGALPSREPDSLMQVLTQLKQRLLNPESFVVTQKDTALLQAKFTDACDALVFYVNGIEKKVSESQPSLDSSANQSILDRDGKEFIKRITGLIDALEQTPQRESSPVTSASLRITAYQLVEQIEIITSKIQNLINESLVLSVAGNDASTKAAITGSSQDLRIILKEIEKSFSHMIASKTIDTPSAVWKSAIVNQLETMMNRLDASAVLSRPLQTVSGEQQSFTIAVKLESEMTYANVVVIRKDTKHTKGIPSGQKHYSVSLSLALSGLGPLRASVDYDKGKKASIEVAVASKNIREWFVAHAEELTSALVAQGLVHPAIAVSVDPLWGETVWGGRSVDSAPKTDNLLDLMV